MEIRPILATLHKHKLTAILLTLQVAFTCAIVCNVAFMIIHREQHVSLPTGIDENTLSVVPVRGIGKDENPWARHESDLALLRQIPGVESAVAVSYSLPLDQSISSYGVCPTQAALDRAMERMSLKGTGCEQASMFDGSPGLLRTLGLDLVAGRDFRRDEYVQGQKDVAVAIISQAFAHHLYPGESALGKTLHIGHHVARVVGVVRTLLSPVLMGKGTDYDTMIWPQLPNDSGVEYVLRSAPQDRRRVLDAARAALLKADPSRIIDSNRMQTYSQIRAHYFQRDTTMIGLLVASALGLLFVTALGITGLANFWVGQRTRSIGIRRAIGATRGDILRYFQTENFLIVTFGVVLGVLLAVALNLLLMKHYELPRLPLWYLPVGAVVLWLLGQLAVLAPALRASNVPPVVATRSM
ncbi:MAG TPA: FtsX-like permease family protein [Rhodanobacteraceae bacterium]|jgi:putative ABC transport system permease protein|nr:FtsX-like permease family protein [Rhodanobacteraceae bacterium]